MKKQAAEMQEQFGEDVANTTSAEELQAMSNDHLSGRGRCLPLPSSSRARRRRRPRTRRARGAWRRPRTTQWRRRSQVQCAMQPDDPVREALHMRQAWAHPASAGELRFQVVWRRDIYCTTHADSWRCCPAGACIGNTFIERMNEDSMTMRSWTPRTTARQARF